MVVLPGILGLGQSPLRLFLGPLLGRLGLGANFPGDDDDDLIKFEF